MKSHQLHFVLIIINCAVSLCAAAIAESDQKLIKGEKKVSSYT
jgi:hypothetical protein